MLFYNIKTFIIHYYIIEWLAYSSKWYHGQIAHNAQLNFTLRNVSKCLLRKGRKKLAGLLGIFLFRNCVWTSRGQVKDMVWSVCVTVIYVVIFIVALFCSFIYSWRCFDYVRNSSPIGTKKVFVVYIFCCNGCYVYTGTNRVNLCVHWAYHRVTVILIMFITIIIVNSGLCIRIELHRGLWVLSSRKRNGDGEFTCRQSGIVKRGIRVILIAS